MSAKTYIQRLSTDHKAAVDALNLRTLVSRKNNEFRKTLNELDNKLSDAKFEILVVQEAIDALDYEVELELSSETLNPIQLLELRKKKAALKLSLVDKKVNVITIEENIKYLKQVIDELFPEVETPIVTSTDNNLNQLVIDMRAELDTLKEDKKREKDYKTLDK